VGAGEMKRPLNARFMGGHVHCLFIHKIAHDLFPAFLQDDTMVTDLKRQPDYTWLKEADSQVLQAKIEDLDRAFENLFERRANYPRFKSKKDQQSIRYPQRFKFNGNRIYLPKVGWVKAVFHRSRDGDGCLSQRQACGGSRLGLETLCRPQYGREGRTSAISQTVGAKVEAIATSPISQEERQPQPREGTAPCGSSA